MDLLKLEEKINFAKQELITRIDYMITRELNFKKMQFTIINVMEVVIILNLKK